MRRNFVKDMCCTITMPLCRHWLVDEEKLTEVRVRVLLSMSTQPAVRSLCTGAGFLLNHLRTSTTARRLFMFTIGFGSNARTKTPTLLKTTPFCLCVLGLFGLSVAPHQEARFLTPLLLPLSLLAGFWLGLNRFSGDQVPAFSALSICIH